MFSSLGERIYTRFFSKHDPPLLSPGSSAPAASRCSSATGPFCRTLGTTHACGPCRARPSRRGCPRRPTRACASVTTGASLRRGTTNLCRQVKAAGIVHVRSACWAVVTCRKTPYGTTDSSRDRKSRTAADPTRRDTRRPKAAVERSSVQAPRTENEVMSTSPGSKMAFKNDGGMTPHDEGQVYRLAKAAEIPADAVSTDRYRQPTPPCAHTHTSLLPHMSLTDVLRRSRRSVEEPTPMDRRVQWHSWSG